MWWEDCRWGDVVEDERGKIWQVIEGTTPERRDAWVKAYEWTNKWEGPTTIHVGMQDLVFLRAVVKWSDDE